MSHVCLRCGLELARVRAVPDPHYALAVVVCPRCTAATVRGGDRVVAGYRRWRQVRRSLQAMASNLALGLLLLLTIVGVSAVLGRELREIRSTPWGAAGALLGVGEDPRVREWLVEDALLAVVGGAAAAVAAGAWLTASLWHLGWRGWVGWAGLVLLVVNAELVVIPIGRLYGRLIGDPLTAPLPSAQEVGFNSTLAGAALLVGLAGVPVGRGVRSMSDAWARRRMSRHRQRLQRLQRGHAA